MIKSCFRSYPLIHDWLNLRQSGLKNSNIFLSQSSFRTLDIYDNSLSINRSFLYPIATFLDHLGSTSFMKNAERIEVWLSDNKCVSAKIFGEEVIVYRIPYSVLRSKSVDLPIDNQFIVYILAGKDRADTDSVYVGKSTNGLDNWPDCHEDKDCSWSQCYIVTEKSDSFLNDGIIQYIEYCVCKRAEDRGILNNTVFITDSKAANEMDRFSADKLLDRAYRLLNVLGLDLITNRTVNKASNYSKPVEKQEKTIRDLDLTSDQLEIMNFICDALLKIDPHLRVVVNNSSWNYVRFSFADKYKALVYCRGIKKKRIIRAYIQGTSDFFNDPEVKSVSPTEVYGECKSIFDVRTHSDAVKLINMCAKAYQKYK